MSVETFFEYFLLELQENKSLEGYYKFLVDDSNFHFRKAYFCQRLEYISNHIGSKDQKIWDCGSGYGTTALYLALNGYKVHGSTLEFYYEQLPERLRFWSQYGDVGLFSCSYEDLYSINCFEFFDTVIVQDTLHHLEPLDAGIGTLSKSLKPGGRLLVVEENGSNPIQSLKLFWQRGRNKNVQLWDNLLQKNIVFADEQIKSFHFWKEALAKKDLQLDAGTVQFVRFFPPFLFRFATYQTIISWERKLSRLRFLARLFFFGQNFIAVKT